MQVADSRCIHARRLNHTNEEALLAYLLVDALSYSMVRLGREPLHATAVLTDRGAIGVIGESGFGKSTLGACLVRSGCRLITDDMLVLTFDGAKYVAHAGPPRLKLYRPIADRIFGAGYRGVPMNAVTEKLIVPLTMGQAVRHASPLAALYFIQPGRRPAPQRPTIRTLSPARAFPRILAATPGHYAYERDRLARQLTFASALAARIPVKTLSYARDPNQLELVRDAVLADVERSAG